MRVRLRKWHFVCIVLSLAWAAGGAGYWTSLMNENAWADAEETFLYCRDGQPRNASFDDCLEDMQSDYDANADLQTGWEPLARTALPILSLWLGAYGVMAMVRWGRALKS